MNPAARGTTMKPSDGRRFGLGVIGLLAWCSLTPTLADGTTLAASAAWSRPTASAAMPGVVYVTVTDSGAPTTLVRIATPIAAQAQMHRSLMQNGMMEMLPVASLPVAPGKPITFGPGGYHIMLTGLNGALSAGQTFPLTLTFVDGSRITTTVTVLPMTADAPATTMGGMKMSP
jgi:copper(I)-binding protein